MPERWRSRLEVLDGVRPSGDVFPRALQGPRPAPLPAERRGRLMPALVAIAVFVGAAYGVWAAFLAPNERTVAPGPGGNRIVALWPERTASEVLAADGRAGRGDDQWRTDPRSVAARFVESVLQWPQGAEIGWSHKPSTLLAMPGVPASRSTPRPPTHEIVVDRVAGSQHAWSVVEVSPVGDDRTFDWIVEPGDVLLRGRRHPVVRYVDRPRSTFGLTVPKCPSGPTRELTYWSKTGWLGFGSESCGSDTGYVYAVTPFGTARAQDPLDGHVPSLVLGARLVRIDGRSKGSEETEGISDAAHPRGDFVAIWPERTRAELRAAQGRIRDGREEWRTIPVEVAWRFARQVLGWEPDVREAAQKLPAASIPTLFRVVNADSGTGDFGFGPEFPTLFVSVEQLGRPGPRGAWSVTRVFGTMNGDETVSLQLEASLQSGQKVRASFGVSGAALTVSVPDCEETRDAVGVSKPYPTTEGQAWSWIGVVRPAGCREGAEGYVFAVTGAESVAGRDPLTVRGPLIDLVVVPVVFTRG